MSFTHYMKLQNRPFSSIKEGTKTVELRLFDEKRRLLKIGDFIEFTNISDGETILTRVTGLLIFKDFEDLYKEISPSAMGYKKGERVDPKDMEEYYSIEDIEKYGVIGIELFFPLL